MKVKKIMSILSVTMCLTFGVTSISPAIQVQATTVEGNLNECLDEDHEEHEKHIDEINMDSNEMVALSNERWIPDWMLKEFMKFVYKDAVHAVHSLNNWIAADVSGYNRWCAKYNEGGTHCRNMCGEHKNINPYNYGFKNSYNCKH